MGIRLAIAAPNIRRGDGQGRVMLEITRVLAGRGHQITCYSASCPEELTRLDNLEWRQVRRTAGPDITGIFTYPLSLTRAVDSGEHDAAFIIGACAVPRIPFAYYAPFTQIGWRRAWADFGRPDLLRQTASAASAFWERRAVSRASAILATSKRILLDLRPLALRGAQLEVVYGGVDLEEFTVVTPDRRSAARSALAIGDESFAILFVGEFSTGRKGLDYLLDAMAAGGEREVLLVRGDGPEEKTRARATQLGIAERVRFLGSGPPAQPLAAADAVAIPSIYEPYSLVALEAAASGVPLVISKYAGATEVLGDSAIEVDPRDVRSIRSALDVLREDPGRAELLASKARRVAEGLSWTKIGETAAGIIESLA